VNEETIGKKYFEVWNKIDLVEDRNELNQKFVKEMELCSHPIIPLSCITKENVPLLLSTISEMSSSLMDKQLVTLTYPCD